MWQGPQWVLATAWFFFTVMPIAFRLAGIRHPKLERKTDQEFYTDQIIKFVNRATLSAVLIWGGFW